MMVLFLDKNSSRTTERMMLILNGTLKPDQNKQNGQKPMREIKGNEIKLITYVPILKSVLDKYSKH